MLKQDGFSTPAGAHNHEDFTRLNLEIQPPQDFLAVIGLAQSAHQDAHAVMVEGGGVHYLSRTRVRR